MFFTNVVFYYRLNTCNLALIFCILYFLCLSCRDTDSNKFENVLSDKLYDKDDKMDVSDGKSTAVTCTQSKDNGKDNLNSLTSVQNLESCMESSMTLHSSDIDMEKDPECLSDGAEKNCNSLQLNETGSRMEGDSKCIVTGEKKDFNASQSKQTDDVGVEKHSEINSDSHSNDCDTKENCNSSNETYIHIEKHPEVKKESESVDSAADKEDSDSHKKVSHDSLQNASIEITMKNLTQERLLKKLGLESTNHIALNGKAVEGDVEMTACSEIDSKSTKYCADISETTNESINKIPNKGTKNHKPTESVLEEIKITDNTQNKSRGSSPCLLINGIIELKKESTETNENKSIKKVVDQKARVNILKEELRVEEAKLLLLRKLLESQCTRKNGMPVKVKDSNKPMNLPSLHPKQTTGRPEGHYPPSATTSQHSSSVHIAPKIVLPQKSNAAGLHLPKVVPSIVSASKTSSTDTNVPRGARVANYVPLHNAATTVTTQPVHKYYIQVGNQLVPAAPPVNQPVYAMPAVAQPNVMAVQTTQANQTSKPQPISNAESQASKHSAAKAALRRQLEQTLLQIPPPRPPPADWNAVPNVNSIDFMMLVGLDEVVDMVLDIGGKPTLKQLLADFMPKSPSICNQCGVDFSPAWKTKTNIVKGENNTLCEKCSMMNVKKELKSEHTSRLKAAFLKALKQEQEIEEKIKAGEDVTIASPPPTDKDHSTQQQVVQHHPQQPGHLHPVHQPHQHQVHSSQGDHHHQTYRHHHHQIVQHYPHHTSLVHQLHQQHMQQQQVDYDKSGRRSSNSARWHPYLPAHHHSGHVHNPQHHRTGRTYVSSSDGRQEYYVVHHPQHSSSGQHTSVRWTR